MVKGVVHFLDLAQEILVLGDFDQPGLPGKLEHADGIVIGAIPELGIEMTEKAAGGRLPSPPEIERPSPAAAPARPGAWGSHYKLW